MLSLHDFREPRWIALLILCAGVLMIVLDNSVVNVALSSIQTDLGFTPTGLGWVVNSYMIGFGGLLLLGGRLGDLLGKKRVFMWGLALFTAGSLLCGCSGTQWMLVASRFAAGIGGAFASSVVLAMIFGSFEEEADRAKALNIFSFTASAGGSIGLLVGGTLTQALNWHWIFLINIPVGIVVLIAGARLLPDERGAGRAGGADWLGAALITAAVMLAVYVLVQLPIYGASLPTLIDVTLTLLLGGAFVYRQHVIAKPLLPLSVFRSRNVTASNVVQVFIVAGLFAFFFLYSLYLRKVLDYDAVRTGFAFLPVTLSIGIFSLGPGAWIMTRFGARRPLIGGLLLAGAGLCIFALASVTAPYVTVIMPAMTLIGIGLGIAFPCMMTFAMIDATPEDSGLISGLTNTTAEVGGAFGVAALAAVAAMAGYRTAFGIGASCLVIGAALAYAFLRMPKRAT